jgi:hypothetical protein
MPGPSKWKFSLVDRSRITNRYSPGRSFFTLRPRALTREIVWPGPTVPVSRGIRYGSSRRRCPPACPGQRRRLPQEQRRGGVDPGRDVARCRHVLRVSRIERAVRQDMGIGDCGSVRPVRPVRSVRTRRTLWAAGALQRVDGLLVDLCLGDRSLFELSGSDAVLRQARRGIRCASERDEQRDQRDDERRARALNRRLMCPSSW